ncbi:shikimate kinase [Bacillus sp. JJ1764]|uniref:shikimate kinase n=1 Tax=Bacillus sp. JJ1764 TaxID=3122964 RepID=UPI002FFDE900
MEKSIVLIGFMGVGKTTIGKLVAERLNYDFIDTDEIIAEEFKLPVSEIFKTFGEKTFREREKSLISNLCKENNKVLSLGGGAFLQEDIRRVCLSTTTVIFLEISFENWKDRLDLIIDSRPILQNKTIAEMEELYHFRQEIYANHHLKINTDDQTPEDITNQIYNLLHSSRSHL